MLMPLASNTDDQAEIPDLQGLICTADVFDFFCTEVKFLAIRPLMDIPGAALEAKQMGCVLRFVWYRVWLWVL